jgi:single-stranded DNA-binding protein
MDANNPTQNLVHLTGYIGATPQLRDMGNGEYVANIVVYTKCSWRRGEQTIIQNDRLPLTAYGHLAQRAAKLTSGQLVQCTARLKNDRWQDRVSGEWRSALRVVVTAIAVITRPAPAQEQEAEEPPVEEPSTAPAPDPTDAPPEVEQPRRRNRRKS